MAAAPKLPDDCLLEIFSWLPAKQICKLKSINKSFRASLSEPHFVKQHVAHVKADSGIIVQSRSDSSFHMVFLDSSSGIPNNALEFLDQRSQCILASASGLICFLTKSSFTDSVSLCVFNAVTEAYDLISFPLEIHAREDLRISVSMSFVDDDMHYELVCSKQCVIFDASFQWEVLLACWRYKSRDGRWEYLTAIGAGPRKVNIAVEDPIASGRWIYWLSVPFVENRNQYIVGFDIKTKSSRMISLPQEAPAGKYTIKVAPWANESVCLIQYRNSSETFSVWEMKSSQQVLWTKIVEVNLGSLFMSESGSSGIDVNFFTVINSDLLVFCIREGIYAYSLSEKKLLELGKQRNQFWRPLLRSYANVLRT